MFGFKARGNYCTETVSAGRAESSGAGIALLCCSCCPDVQTPHQCDAGQARTLPGSAVALSWGLLCVTSLSFSAFIL